MMIKEFHYTFEQLIIHVNEIEELLGFEKDSSPEPFPELISNGLSEASKHCTIQGGFKTYSTIQINQSESTIEIEGQKFEVGKIVATQLRKATQSALFLCTAGSEISQLSQKYNQEGDTVMSFIIDTIGSVTVEKAMDKIQESLKTEMNKVNLNISDRFSPGYCNWSVAEQHKLFSLLPQAFCNIQLSPSALMNPIKSVSGIIGIGTELREKGYQCNWCDDSDCIYGKIRRLKKR